MSPVRRVKPNKRLSEPQANAIKLVELIDTLDEGVERHGL